VSKKGPRSDAFRNLARSLSDEVIERYLEIARQVRDQELARRREMERRKAAEKRARLALLAALGLVPLQRKKKKTPQARKTGSGATGKSRKAGKGAGGKNAAAPPATARPPRPAPVDAGAASTDLATHANKGQGKKPKPITREDILKLAIADELGYLDTVRSDGWGGLTTAQSGRVGGMMTRRMRRLEKGLPPF